MLKVNICLQILKKCKVFFPLRIKGKKKKKKPTVLLFLERH